MLWFVRSEVATLWDFGHWMSTPFIDVIDDVWHRPTISSQTLHGSLPDSGLLVVETNGDHVGTGGAMWQGIQRVVNSQSRHISHKTKLTNSRCHILTKMIEWYNIYVYPNEITCNQTTEHSTHQCNIVSLLFISFIFISMCMHVHFKFECWRLFIRAAPALHWWRRWLPHGRQRRSLLFAVRTTSAAPWSHGRLLFVNGRSSGRSMDTQEVWLASRGWQVSLKKWCTFWIS